MEIICIEDYHMGENTYVVGEGSTAFAVDPGTDADKIVKRAAEYGFKITDILLTHGHYDHICGVQKLRNATGARLWASAKTDDMICNSVTNLSEMFGDSMALDRADVVVEDKKKYTVCGINIQVLLTPGHTDGGTCYLADSGNDRVLFSGDTLFCRSVGRTDFPTGDERELVNSIKNVIYKLDDNITVYPGHGGKTSVGYEKKFNLLVNDEG